MKKEFKVIHRDEDRWEVWERSPFLIWFNRVSLFLELFVFLSVFLQQPSISKVFAFFISLLLVEFIRGAFICALIHAPCESPIWEDIYSGYVYREWELTEEAAVERVVLIRQYNEEERERRKNRRVYYL
ncbi:hypothetical protein [Synechococcus elongatus]|uniref:hypothetical protein n=1 Tax=Synechococcus elongatus TaxID=32046 RepID=UPI000F7DACD6|nr:hypothetical protein [Synechococcus elongatus]